MVRCLKVKKELGEQVRKFLQSKSWLDKSRIIGKTARYLLFPLTNEADIPLLAKTFSSSIEQRSLEEVKHKKAVKLKEALKKVVPADKIGEIRSGFDIIGDIAVVEIPDSLEKLDKSIAWTLKRLHPNIRVVAKRGKKTEGKYRIRKVSVLVGENRTETTHLESGVRIKTDLNKAYFSSRMGSERLRIAKQVKDGENILDMFAGVGPYPILLAKKKRVKVWAVEINPAAIKYMKENIRINQLRDKIAVFEGDAKDIVPKIKRKFDRIVMVLPDKAHKFLKEALAVSKKNTIIHLYQFVHKNDFKKRGGEIKALCRKISKDVRVLRAVRTGYYSPKVYRVCYDLKVI